MSATHCDVHGVPWKTVPGGVSNKTGKPYNAFQACQVQGCDQRPPKMAQATQAAPQAVQQRTPAPQTNGAGEARLRAACAAWAGACEVSPAEKVLTLADAAYRWMMACYQGQPVQTAPVQQREPGEDDDLNF